MPSSEIHTTKAALTEEEQPAVPQEPQYIPAISVNTSLASRGHIISLIDGRPYKSLKRHLSTHGLTPADYRDRYNLPGSYPMVMPGYLEQRRQVAKQLGLGLKKTRANTGSATASVEDVAATTAKTGRRTKAVSTPAKANGRAKTQVSSEDVQQADWGETRPLSNGCSPDLDLSTPSDHAIGRNAVANATASFYLWTSSGIINRSDRMSMLDLADEAPASPEPDHSVETADHRQACQYFRQGF